MTTIKDIEVMEKLREERREPVRRFEPATMIEIGGSVEVPNRPDYVWVQEYGQPQSVFQILNRRVAPLGGLTVKIGYPEKPPFTRQVMDVWDDIGDLTGYTPGDGSTMYPHAQSHQYPSEASPGTDPVLIYQPAIQMLKTTTTGSGLIVTVWPLPSYWTDVYASFLGGFVNLASYLPAANMIRFVLIYLDTGTNTMLVVPGTEVVDTNPNPPKPTLPAGGIPSSFVLLSNGQTDIATADITDARDFLGLLGSGDGYPFTVITVDLSDPAADYDNVEDAIGAASAGSVIVIGPGNYNISAGITTPSQSVLIGHGKDVTTITRTGSSTAVTLGQDSQLLHLTVTCTNNSGEATAVSVPSPGCQITDCRAEGISPVFFSSLGAAPASGYFVETLDLILRDSDGYGSSAADDGYGIYFDVDTSGGEVVGDRLAIINGEFNGSTADISDNGSTSPAPVHLVDPRCLNGTVDLSIGDGHYVSVDGDTDKFSLFPYVRLPRGKILIQNPTNLNPLSPDDSMNGHYLMSRIVTHDSASWFSLYLEGVATNLTVAVGEIIYFDIMLVGTNDIPLLGSPKSLVFRIDGAIRNLGGTTALLFSNVSASYKDDANYDARVLADDTNDCLLLQVMESTGVTMDVVYWVANIRTVQTRT